MKNRVLVFWKKYSYLIMLSNLLVGLIHPMAALIFIICMMGPALIGFFTGRFWCGNICPIGNFFDNVSIKISRNYKAPIIYKSKCVKITVAFIMIGMFVFNMKSAFGNGNQVGLIYYKMIIESIVIGTLLSLIYNHRIWCHFCPMGSMGALAAKFSKNKKVLHVSSECTSCRKCSSKCIMGLSPADFKGNKINSPDCIQCGKCMDICAGKAISYNKLKSKNKVILNLHIAADKDSTVNTEGLLEEKMAAAIIFTIPIIMLSMDLFSSHLLNNAVSFEKLAIMRLILISIVILTCVDFFQIGLSLLFKRSPDIYSVITAGILSWYVYQIIVVFLVITVEASFINKQKILLLAITVTGINIIRYLRHTGKIKL